MSAATATIRELRTDFRSVKRKIEHHGQVIITDNGVPSYEIKALPTKTGSDAPMPDYMARLKKRQPRPMSAKETREFWDYERGER
jgi:antitoxin (DNA-binding transcriptional repressor) of toxin-antitoxin stability system